MCVQLDIVKQIKPLKSVLKNQFMHNRKNKQFYIAYSMGNANFT